jgi:hypothetical protein
LARSRAVFHLRIVGIVAGHEIHLGQVAGPGRIHGHFRLAQLFAHTGQFGPVGQGVVQGGKGIGDIDGIRGAHRQAEGHIGFDPEDFRQGRLGQALPVAALDQNFFGFGHAHLEGEQIGSQGPAGLKPHMHDAQLGAGGFHRFFGHPGEVGRGENVVVGADGVAMT